MTSDHLMIACLLDRTTLHRRFDFSRYILLRFRKSVKIIPGVRLNFSKSGVSTSIGGKGVTVNLGKRGVRSTLSVPGTGLSWSSTSGWAEGHRSSLEDEIAALQTAALKATEVVSREAEKANAVFTKIDRAIVTLNSGRGLTYTKAQNFEKRILAEEQKLGHVQETVLEQRLFLEAVHMRLMAMRFGLFAGSLKRRRDKVAETVGTCSDEVTNIERQLQTAGKAIFDKLSEVKDGLATLANET